MTNPEAYRSIIIIIIYKNVEAEMTTFYKKISHRIYTEDLSRRSFSLLHKPIEDIPIKLEGFD